VAVCFCDFNTWHGTSFLHVVGKVRWLKLGTAYMRSFFGTIVMGFACRCRQAWVCRLKWVFLFGDCDTIEATGKDRVGLGGLKVVSWLAWDVLAVCKFSSS
jgi:hypothetical protein